LDSVAAFWATPTTQDRVQLTEKFLVGCIDNGIDFPVVLSATGAGSREAVHLQAAGDVEALCQRLAGKKVKEQFWDKGKQVRTVVRFNRSHQTECFRRRH
jgi:hypothetical protein